MLYFLEVKYNGGSFHGWQIQPNAVTVQQVLEESLSLIFGFKITISGSSRTDTGVHARQQFAQFEIDAPIVDIHKFKLRLNKLLPPTVAVTHINLMPQTAHCRFDATSRKYIYRIIKEKDPFLHETAAVYHHDYNVELMNQAANYLLKYTDFEAFSKVKTDVKTFNCVIEYAYFKQNGSVLEFHIKANRFLRGMVRAIVGTLLKVGIEKISIDQFMNIIESKNRSQASMAAKAEGLCLEEVNYPDGYFEPKIEILEAQTEDMSIIKDMFIEYQNFLGFSLCFQGFDHELQSLPGIYSKPQGIILIAKINGYVVGVVALKRLEEGVCEMKRLYVKPYGRGHHLGKLLIEKLIGYAKESGYNTMKLDTLKRLETAVGLYRKFGFIETKPYNYNPEEDIMYFEKQL